MKTALFNGGYLKKYLSLTTVSILFFTIFITQSCIKDRLKIDKIAGGKWSPEFVAPLAYGNLTMADFVKGSKKTWQEDPNGFLSVIYSKNEISSIGDEVIAIPDQNNDTTINFIIPPSLPVGDSVSVNLNYHAEFSGNVNEQIDSILFKSGTLEFTITTDLNHDSYIEISIPKLTKGGIPYHKKLDFKYTGNSTTTKSISINLKDYYLVLSGGTAGQPSFIEQDIKISATKLNNPNNSPYFYKVKQKITNLKYYLVMGYFHQHNIDIDENEVIIDLFDDQMAGAIFAEDPRLTITLNNSYGLPANITFTELYAERDGQKVNFTSTLLPTLNIGYPDFTEIGYADTTHFIFNSNNSNVKNIIQLNPHKFVFKGVVQTNPQGTPIDNFVLDTSHITVDLKIELPLYGRALNFVLRDTTNLEGGDDETDTYGVEKVTLRLKTINRFPTDVTMQVYMTDSLYNVIDSIFDSGGKILDAAPVSGAPDYRVTSGVKNTTYVTLTPDQLENYKKARKLLIETHSSTTNAGTSVVKIYSDNGVYFELSAKAKYTNNF